jgi:hypothetical protein
MFLIGPFLYFYVRGNLTSTKKLSFKDRLHFLPALVSLIGTIPYYCTPFDTKLTSAKQLITQINSIRNIDVNLFYDAGESFIIRAVLCLVYVLFSGYRVIIYYKKNRNLNPHQSLLLRWLTILLSATLIITSLFLGMAIEATYVNISEIIASGYAFYFLFINGISLIAIPLCIVWYF